MRAIQLTKFATVTFLAIALPPLSQPAAGGASDGDFRLHTGAFRAGGEIPAKFTCSGSNVSPALSWDGSLPGTKSFALIADDPDAPGGTWVHWVAYDLPAETHQLREGLAAEEQIAGGGTQGRNSFEKIGYGGPCPPPGKAHRYFFKLYALDSKLNLKAGASKTELEAAMKGHVLATAELIGRYHR